MTDVSPIVISVLPGEFWMPGTTVSPSRTGTLVMMPSKGASYSRLAQHVAACRSMAAF